MSLRNALVASSLLIAASASLVGAQTPPCAISGLTFCYPVSDHNDIGIADGVFSSSLESIVEYTAGEYDRDTNLDVEATDHNTGKDYKITAYEKKRGNYESLGWVDLYGEEWWGKKCAYTKFKSNGLGEVHITCPQGETIYSAKIHLNGPLIASTALGMGITEERLRKHVMMHEFYHAVGFLGHPTSCTIRVVDNCNSAIVLCGNDVPDINSQYP